MSGSQRLATPAGLAALVSSRLCHDLISPIGAIGNGLELLQALVRSSPELDLVAESATVASAKVRFFRIAFGAAGEGETIDARSLSDMVRGMYGAGRIALRWQPEPMPRRDARLLFLLVLAAESALPVGGTLTVEVEPALLRLSAEARRIRIEAELWDHLVRGDPLPACTAAQVHFPLARAFAAEAGRRIGLEVAEDGFVLVSEPAAATAP